MKNLHSRLFFIARFIMFPLSILFRSGKKYAFIIGLLVLVCLTGCYSYFYRTNTTNSIDAGTIRRLQSQDKYFIIHFSNNIIETVKDLSVDADSLKGTRVPLTVAHSRYVYPDSKEKNRVKREDRASAFTEVHLYTTDSANTRDPAFAVSLASFNRADVYEFNREATKQNHILSTVGIVVTAAAVAGLVAFVIVLMTCNCPQVHVHHNGQYQFASGLYSGAVYSTLERMDYLPLNTVPYDAREISLKISNNKNEEQFINKVELIQVMHNPGVKVLPDKNGKILTYSELNEPLTGTAEAIRAVLSRDQQYYAFDNKANENGFSDVRLTFNKPGNTDRAKLVISARNSYWGGLIHKEFINLFGDNFAKWQQKQEKADPETLKKWQTDQALPLMVYLKTSKGWKFVDYFPLIGNTATRDMIMEINTSDIVQDQIELKLESVYKFWDLDYVGMDFTPGENLNINAIQPVIAAKHSTDQPGNLESNHKKYTHLHSDSEAIYFKYTIAELDTTRRSSYILASGGYYHNLEKITGQTNYAELYKFKNKGAFDRFSREKHRQSQEITKLFNVE